MLIKTLLNLKNCRFNIFKPSNNLRIQSEDFQTHLKYIFKPHFRTYTTNREMSKTALVFLAPGYEELEFITSVDILRRAGVNVTIAGLPDKNPVKSARNVLITPDIGLNEAVNAGPFDVLVLPGGLGGSKAMADSADVGKLLKDQENCGRKVAAICAAPTALKVHCIGLGKKVTSYPSMAPVMQEGSAYDYKEQDVVVDGNLITSRGPGTAAAFSLTIVKELLGADKAGEIAKAMLISF